MPDLRVETPNHQPLHSRQVDLLLDKAGSLLAHSLDLPSALERLGDLFVPQFADWCGIVLRSERDDWTLSQSRYAAPEMEQLEDFYRSWKNVRSWSQHVLESDQPMLIDDVTDAWLRKQFLGEELDAARDLKVRSCLYLPLQLDGKLLGAILLLILDENRQRFAVPDQSVARRLALIAAAVVRNATLWDALQRELSDGRVMEETLRASLEREARRSTELQTLIDAIPAGVWIVENAEGTVIRCNTEAFRQMRMPVPADFAPIHHVLTSLSLPQVRIEGKQIHERAHPLFIAASEGLSFEGMESEWIFPDGTRSFHSFGVTPLFDEDDHPKGAIKVAFDITRLKTTEEELRRHREDLERLVDERSRQLELAYERLLQAEQLAAIGTLSAGLGHDMGNLLLPLRLRLDSLNSMLLPPDAAQDLRAIADVVEYLQRLTSGLRLLAADPKTDTIPSAPTRLRAWWKDGEPLFRASLPAGVVLEHDIPFGLPPIRMPAGALTQVIFNLVQNAGQAMQAAGGGRVRIVAKGIRRREVRITVEDNGPGMDAETVRRCFEPYFSTKKRQISTGLGLPLVRALLLHTGGDVAVQSEAEKGTVFELTIPAAEARIRRRRSRRSSNVARVTVQDERIRALITSLLKREQYFVGETEALMQGQGRLWITDEASIRRPQDVLDFVVNTPGRMVVVVNARTAPVQHPRVFAVESAGQVTHLRSLIKLASRTRDGGGGSHDPAPEQEEATPPEPMAAHGTES